MNWIKKKTTIKKPINDTKQSIENSINWNFIEELEGWSLQGYVPEFPNERNNRVLSGVTIVSGFDLGQHTQAYLDKIGVGKKIQQKLKPYLGLTGKKAEVFIDNIPLTLTQQEAESLDKKVRKKFEQELKNSYNKASKGILFKDLNKEQRTVIMSVAFQYGNLKIRTPRFWKFVTTQDWASAVKELENFRDSYTRRRLKEAKLLKKSI